jgi:hypothetical protein
MELSRDVPCHSGSKESFGNASDRLKIPPKLALLTVTSHIPGAGNQPSHYKRFENCRRHHRSKRSPLRAATSRSSFLR